MLKTIDIVLIAVMVSAAAWTYKIKHEAELIEDQVAAVQHKIDLEHETIALLQADWSLLNQPNRLQRLAEAFQDQLHLMPIQPDQIVEPDELPAEPVHLVPNPNTNLGGYAATTGSVVR
ncbi:cell division protein FtsL [Mangrovibrevibacter kandeliae]|uniref:cell division protein FtsL n=1 Tax=Mangrovibrevibacter kandeliae TaxID=2968473 RepID=UPI00211842B8|nr:MULTISPECIES: hypothetical protein [unclassified Aurantimonas]MCQ8783957.1 hypothetical protein [Aurantimonas sp. CSK15Z-1]MCW4116674.1 hypothetical protein [Aurantimonas sp. MSK8Z-1]